jgi:anti-sigma B factor antagonist
VQDWPRRSGEALQNQLSMEIQRQNGTLMVAEVMELKEAAARQFREEVHAWLASDLQSIEIDLSQTLEVDSCGLAALVSIYETANRRRAVPVTIRLVHPQPVVQQVLELTRLHHVFEIVPLDWESVPDAISASGSVLSLSAVTEGAVAETDTGLAATPAAQAVPKEAAGRAETLTDLTS